MNYSEFVCENYKRTIFVSQPSNNGSDHCPISPPSTTISIPRRERLTIHHFSRAKIQAKEKLFPIRPTIIFHPSARINDLWRRD